MVQNGQNIKNDPIWFKRVQYGPQFYKTILNVSIYPKMIRYDPKLSNSFQNGPKLLNMVQYGPTFNEMVLKDPIWSTRVQNGSNGQKKSRLVKNCSKLPQKINMLQNGP